MSRTIYVGNLPLDVKERELDDVFYKCGRIVEIDLKLPPRPPGFAFIEFESSYDADEAVHRRDGYDFDGYRLRVSPIFLSGTPGRCILGGKNICFYHQLTLFASPLNR